MTRETWSGFASPTHSPLHHLLHLSISTSSTAASTSSLLLLGWSIPFCSSSSVDRPAPSNYIIYLLSQSHLFWGTCFELFNKEALYVIDWG